MKMIALVVLMFLFNGTIAVLAEMSDELGLTSAGTDTTTMKISEDDVTDILTDVETGFQPLDWALQGGSYILKGIKLLFEILYDTTIGMPEMLHSSPFNVPTPIINYILIPAELLIMVGGIAEFLRVGGGVSE